MVEHYTYSIEAREYFKRMNQELKEKQAQRFYQCMHAAPTTGKFYDGTVAPLLTQKNPQTVRNVCTMWADGCNLDLSKGPALLKYPRPSVPLFSPLGNRADTRWHGSQRDPSGIL